jgi:hypothetical protein
MGAGHQRAGHQTRLALDGPRYFLTVDMRTLIKMTGSSHSRRFGIGRESAYPLRTSWAQGSFVAMCQHRTHVPQQTTCAM